MSQSSLLAGGTHQPQRERNGTRIARTLKLSGMLAAAASQLRPHG